MNPLLTKLLAGVILIAVPFLLFRASRKRLLQQLSTGLLWGLCVICTAATVVIAWQDGTTLRGLVTAILLASFSGYIAVIAMSLRRGP